MPLSANAKGSVIMTGSMLGFAINDALMKATFDTLPFGEGILIRGVFATALIALLAWRTGAFAFRPTRREEVAILIRALAETAGTITFMVALAHLPLASASAGVQAAPLAVTVAAALFLREQVGWQRWTAICVGFVGMLVMLRPGTDAFDPYMPVLLLTVLCIVVRDMATRLLPDHVPTLYASVQTAAIITLSGAALIPFEGFVPPSAGEVGLYALASVAVIAGYILGVQSVRVGDISAVSPFRYTVLLFSVVLGYLMFGHVPDAATFVGAAIVIGAGLFTLYREMKVSRMRPAASSPVREFAPE